MTVQTQNATQYFEGPITVGSTLSIVNFTFINNTHVSVKVRGEDIIWTYGEDYTIEGANTEQRTVHILKAVEEGQVLAVYLDVPITQNVEPEEGGDFPASTQEFVLDKLTYICQMLYERITRSLQVSVDTAFDGVLYNVEENAGKAIIVNATGTGVGYSAYNIDDLEAIVRRIFQSIPEIDAVGDNIGSVITDAQNINQIKTTANSITNVNNVGNSIANVNIVGNDLALNSNSNIKKVVANKTNIDTVASNIADVQHAYENAQIAKTSAAEAKQWAIGSPIQPSGYSAKYWAEKGKTDVEAATKTAKTTIETAQGTAVKAVNDAKNTAIQVIGADVISANEAAARAQEASAKALGWNITYIDEDSLDFTDLTQGEIDRNIDYIKEAGEQAISRVNNATASAINAVNQAAQDDFTLMDEYVQHVNNAMVQTQAAETRARQAENAAQNSQDSAAYSASQAEASANLAIQQTGLCQAAKQQAEASATSAAESATNANNSSTQAAGYLNQTQTAATQGIANIATAGENAVQEVSNTKDRAMLELLAEVEVANNAAIEAQKSAMQALGWDIKYEDEDSLDFSSNAANFEAKLKALPGYSETGTQVFKSVNGALQWVTE